MEESKNPNCTCPGSDQVSKYLLKLGANRRSGAEKVQLSGLRFGQKGSLELEISHQAANAGLSNENLLKSTYEADDHKHELPASVGSNLSAARCLGVCL